MFISLRFPYFQAVVSSFIRQVFTLLEVAGFLNAKCWHVFAAAKSQFYRIVVAIRKPTPSSNVLRFVVTRVRIHKIVIAVFSPPNFL
jgi:hypothetical protein